MSNERKPTPLPKSPALVRRTAVVAAAVAVAGCGAGAQPPQVDQPPQVMRQPPQVDVAPQPAPGPDGQATDGVAVPDKKE